MHNASANEHAALHTCVGLMHVCRGACSFAKAECKFAKVFADVQKPPENCTSGVFICTAVCLLAKGCADVQKRHAGLQGGVFVCTNGSLHRDRLSRTRCRRPRSEERRVGKECRSR